MPRDTQGNILPTVVKSVRQRFERSVQTSPASVMRLPDVQKRLFLEEREVFMYQCIPTVAQTLGISEGLIDSFLSKGWITAVQKDGLMFLARHQQYKIRFIQHLRDRMSLSDEQIALVLRFEQPPYSLEQVESILRAHSVAV